MLLAMFKMIGNVQTAHVDHDSTSGKTNGCGTVVMATSQEAHDCVHYFNGQIKEGLALSVEIDVPVVAKPTTFKTFQKKPAFFKKTARNLTRRVAGDSL